MTPDEIKAVVQSGVAANLLRGLQVLDIAALDGNRARVIATFPGVGQLSAEFIVPFGPLPIPRAQLLGVVKALQDALGRDAARFETDIGRGFNSAGRGAIATSRGYRAEDGYV